MLHFLTLRHLFDWVGAESNIAEQLFPIHTMVVDIKNVSIEFLHWVTVGTGIVVGIILLIGACIPRRSTALSGPLSRELR